MLIEKGCNINAKDESGNFGLKLAVANHNLRLTHFLLSEGAYIHEEDEEGHSILHIGANALGKDSNANPELLEVLLSSGGSADSEDSLQRKPLHYLLTSIPSNQLKTHSKKESKNKRDPKEDSEEKKAEEDSGEEGPHKAKEEELKDSESKKEKEGCSKKESEYNTKELLYNLNKEDREYYDPINSLSSFFKFANNQHQIANIPHPNSDQQQEQEEEQIQEMKELEIDCVDVYGKSPLHYAAQHGALLSSLFLIDKNAQIERSDRFGNTPLALAFLYNHPDYAIALIQKGASLGKLVYQENAFRSGMQSQIPTQITRTAKFAATEIVKKSQSRIMQPRFSEKIQKNRSRIETDDGFFSYNYGEEGESMFRIALRNGWQGLTYLILDTKYDLLKALEDCLLEHQYQLFLNLLLSIPIDKKMTRVNRRGQNLIHILSFTSTNASESDISKMFYELKKRGVIVNKSDEKGRIPLHYAVDSQNKVMIDLLLNHSNDPNHLDNDNHTPVTITLKGERIFTHFAILQILLEAGGNSNIKFKETLHLQERTRLNSENLVLDSLIATPLSHLLMCKNAENTVYSERITEEDKKNLKEVIPLLLHYGCSPFLKDSDEKDSFMYALQYNDIPSIELFLSQSSPSLPPLQEDVLKQLDKMEDQNENKDEEMHEKLKSQSSFPPFYFENVDNNGKSVMHYVVLPFPDGSGSRDTPEIIRLLADKGFSYNMKDSGGKTPLDYAKSKELLQTIQVLGEEIPLQTQEYKKFKTVINILMI